MKGIPFTLLLVLLGTPIPVFAAEQLVPAGSLLQCSMSEPKFSSKTAAVGDPVLCQLGMTALDGPAILPFNSYLEGRFQAYKNPGHFVGKGWLQLSFDRMFIEPDTVIPVQTKIVNVSGFNINRQGEILGRGHAVRDTVEWMIPILWPIDLVMLPRRGPRPTLGSETEITLKVMNDFALPMTPRPRRDRAGLLRRPASYSNRRPAAAPAQPIQQSDVPPAQQSVIAASAPEAPPYPEESFRPAYYAPPPEYYYPPPSEYYYQPRPQYYYPPAYYPYPEGPGYGSPYGPWNAP
jgi:hypothetical protein